MNHPKFASVAIDSRYFSSGYDWRFIPMADKQFDHESKVSTHYTDGGKSDTATH